MGTAPGLGPILFTPHIQTYKSLILKAYLVSVVIPSQGPDQACLLTACDSLDATIFECASSFPQLATATSYIVSEILAWSSCICSNYHQLELWAHSCYSCNLNFGNETQLVAYQNAMDFCAPTATSGTTNPTTNIKATITSPPINSPTLTSVPVTSRSGSQRTCYFEGCWIYFFLFSILYLWSPIFNLACRR